ncbi:putative gustatory receptor 98c isoform X2 [Musca autumnalis]|uniref:putative gustatory receptor 98c isoform X2 n=1 Tax=Musca autumnalis TaxID=221902 RepID=UPI003CF57946
MWSKIRKRRAATNYLYLIQFYQWIFTIFGINLPPDFYREFNDSLKRKLLLSFYTLYCVVLFTMAVLTTHTHNNIVEGAIHRHKLDSITQIISYLHHGCIVLFFGCIEIKALMKNNELKEIFNLMLDLENEIPFEYFEIKRMLSLKWKLLRNTGLWIIFLLSATAYLSYVIIAWDMPTFVYDLINRIWESLENLQLKLEFKKRLKVEDSQFSSCTLQQLIKYQQQLNKTWFLIVKIDSYFAEPIFCLFINNGLCIIYTVNWAYLRIIYETMYSTQTLRYSYIFILFLNIYLICYFAENCMKKYRYITEVLNNVKLHPQNVQLGNRLREFYLQLKHQKLTFTCNNFLDINFSNFGKMVLIVFSFIVILIQFKMEDLSTGAAYATQQIFGRKQIKIGIN